MATVEMIYTFLEIVDTFEEMVDNFSIFVDTFQSQLNCSLFIQNRGDVYDKTGRTTLGILKI